MFIVTSISKFSNYYFQAKEPSPKVQENNCQLPLGLGCTGASRQTSV